MTIFAIIAHTQVLENYGTEDTPYWKPKLGSSYWIANIDAEHRDQAARSAGQLPSISNIETRNSTMLIEYVKQIDAISIDDAERRSKINRNDPNIEPETYFDFVERVEPILSYTTY